MFMCSEEQISQREIVKQLIAALNDIAANETGVNALSPQVEIAHIHRYYTRHQGLSTRT